MKARPAGQEAVIHCKHVNMSVEVVSKLGGLPVMVSSVSFKALEEAPEVQRR